MVHANIATGNGGGVFLFNGHLVVRESGSITANEAGNYGGGVYAESKMTLRGSAKVTGNTAASSGGIYSDLRVFVCSSSVKISPNNPDDPPNTKSCT
jgi:predicted outer membrane repeat protein